MKKHPENFPGASLVTPSGFEPPTSCMSSKHSPAELRSHYLNHCNLIYTFFIKMSNLLLDGIFRYIDCGNNL